MARANRRSVRGVFVCPPPQPCRRAEGGQRGSCLVATPGLSAQLPLQQVHLGQMPTRMPDAGTGQEGPNGRILEHLGGRLAQGWLLIDRVGCEVCRDVRDVFEFVIRDGAQPGENARVNGIGVGDDICAT